MLDNNSIMGGGVVAVLLQHVQQVKMSTKHYFLRKQCVCWTNLQVTFEFLIVNHDVFSLLALELGLLQTVLQRPQFLQSHTTLFILSSTAFTKKKKRKKNTRKNKKPSTFLHIST